MRANTRRTRRRARRRPRFSTQPPATSTGSWHNWALSATEPVVLTGSCLAPEVLGTRTSELIGARGSARLLRAEQNAAGAAWLAATHVLGAQSDWLASLHQTLTGIGNANPS